MNTLAVVFVIFGTLLGGALAQEGVCPPPAHYWPHENCTLFYTCNPNDPNNHFLDYCPSNLYWNQRVISCDWQWNVPECVGGIRPPITTTAMPNTTTTIGTRPPSTENATIITTTPLPPTNATTMGTTPPAPTNATTMGTTPPVPTNATTMGTTPPAPTNATTMGTTPPAPTNATTMGTTTYVPTTSPTTTTTLAPSECPPTGTVKIPHAELCEAFWLCVEGQKLDQLFLCPGGLFFDPILQKCNLPSEVNCDRGFPELKIRLN